MNYFTKIVSIVLLFWMISIFPKTLKVGIDKEFKTINSAIVAAQNGDTILVNKGHYKEGILLNPSHLSELADLF